MNMWQKNKHKNRGGTWRWNEEVQNVKARRKKMFKTLYKHRSKENRTRYNSTRNKTKKVVARAIKIKDEKEIETLSKTPSKIFKYPKMIKREEKCRRWKMHLRN